MEEKTIIIESKESNFQIEQTMEFQLTFSKDVSEFNFIKYEIAKIDPSSEYNVIRGSFTQDLIKNGDNLYILRLKASILKEGIYFFSDIELLKNEKIDSEFPLKFDDYGDAHVQQRHFRIYSNNEDVKEAIFTEVENIQKNRNENFISGLGDKSNQNFFSSYFFVKNLYLDKQFTYGKLKIIPYSKYSISNIYDYINSFIANEIGLDVCISYDPNDRIKYENPGVVIFYPKIFAKNELEAYNISESITQNLLQSFSLTRDTKGEIISAIVIDSQTKKLFYSKPETFSANNIMSGEMFGEDPYLNQKVLRLIQDDPFFSLLTNLYRDAVNEQHVEIKYSKLWTILEVLAESKKYPENVLKKTYLDGSKIQHKANGNSKIGNSNPKPTIKDKVREYFRDSLKQNPFLSNLLPLKSINVDRIDNLLTIWYRHRNCMVHSGGCQPFNTAVCKNSPDYALCKSKHVEIVKSNPERNIYNDTYLNFLHTSVRCILLNYFLLKTGYKDVNEHFFMVMKAIPSLKLEEININSMGELGKILKIEV
ncbi:hypothetical protein [Pedobacter alluvionis]|uniref:ApeA N-terminal domain-containing protein n=1 Tax=Pedobacter alluvionis TaxID=475253 RepID=A0A497YD47_9SPHI|nr:hypothetical protein [Pedobacter alluvionis]RLJ80608.1 hypothetical protein BCL90_1398 [Pedobacter alluvionis]TFB31872.1 hypothetical protein E3V97_14960 [Pedobacter alluvionis]